jgi:hypothetical protein
MIKEHEPYVIDEAEPHEEEGNSPAPSQIQQYPNLTTGAVNESSPDNHFLNQQQQPSSEGQGSSPQSTNMRSRSRTSKVNIYYLIIT